MEVPRVPVGVFEAEPAFAEIDLAGDAGVDHPLQRAIDGRPADAMVFALDQIDQIVRAEVPFLFQEGVDDQIALARALGACRAQAVEVWKADAGRHAGHLRDEPEETRGRRRDGPLPRKCYALNDDPHPQVEVAFGFLMVKPPPVMVSTKSTSAPFR